MSSIWMDVKMTHSRIMRILTDHYAICRLWSLIYLTCYIFSFFPKWRDLRCKKSMLRRDHKLLEIHQIPDVEFCQTYGEFWIKSWWTRINLYDWLLFLFFTLNLSESTNLCCKVILLHNDYWRRKDELGKKAKLGL